MKRLNFLGLILLMLWACQPTPPERSSPSAGENSSPGPQQHLAKANPAGVYGGGISSGEITALAAVVDAPARFEGQAVRIRGTVKDVCPKRGCWVEVADGDWQIQVKVPDGEIVFPAEAVGHAITVEGVVERLELDEAAARRWKAHEAEEKGAKFDPAAVAGPLTIWRIRGYGAVIGESAAGESE